MGHAAKHLRGCQMCRIRRIKCDRTWPTCKQCVKIRCDCPGYRDIHPSPPLPATGRNGPSEQSKASPSATKRIAPKTDKDTDKPSEDSKSRTSTAAGTKRLLPHPQLSADELASCHFISNYVLIPRQNLPTNRGFLEFVVPLLRQKSNSPQFFYAFKACALASLGNRVGTGNDFDKQALGFYTKALASTFSALKDPVLMKRDETLAAILLLGLFENISAKTLGMFAWSSHTEGAIELVKARGREQLQSKIGLDMFTSVRTQMIIHSLSTGKAPPLDVDWWVKDPISDEYHVEFLQLSSRVGELKSEINNLLATVARSPDNTKLVKEKMQVCKSLDKEIVVWLEQLPDQYDWKTVAWEPYNPKCDYSKAEVFPGRIDRYGDLWSVNLWNVMRCLRIVLASLTIRLTAWINFPADYRTTSEYASTARTVVELVALVIASVPYQMGTFDKRKHLRDSASHSVFGCGEDSSEKSLAGYFLLWPLSCIQGQDYLTDSQRTWVKGRLKAIGNGLGVRYGNMLSQLNVRMPSMLILRDRLKSSPHNPASTEAATTGETLQAPGMASPANVAIPPDPSAPGTGTSGVAEPSMEALQQQEAMHMKVLQRQTQALMMKAVENSNMVDDWTLRKWLQL